MHPPQQHAPISTLLKIGDRVQYKQARGFVRYVGELHGQVGEWIGVDWDDATRGRHDGTLNGVSYFAASGPTSSSFVRAAKLGNGGQRTLMDAIQHRLSAQHETVEDAAVSIHFRTSSERQDGSAKKAPSIDISGLGVTGPIVLNEAELDVESVQSLRAADNLLQNFANLGELLDSFPNLTYLDVSRNRFAVFDAHISSVNTPLYRLDLNSCNVQLGLVWDLCARCPMLAELRLFDAGLTSLQVANNGDVSKLFPHLKLIDLGGNKVPWCDIQHILGSLPSLQELYIGDNDIGLTNEYLDVDNAFPALKRLSLSGNPLSSWSLLTSLVRVPSLRALLVADTPLTRDEQRQDDVPDDTILSRHAIMGRLGQLEKIYGSTIGTDERLYAEKRYLRVECLPALASCSSREAAERLHPRMRELCDKYDVELNTCAKDAVARGATGHADTLRRDLVEVRFQKKDDDICRKMIPRSVHCAKLASLARSFLGVKRSSQMQVRIMHGNACISADAGVRTLAQLRVKPGDEVVVEVAGG